jgi:hypothetical protein
MYPWAYTEGSEKEAELKTTVGAREAYEAKRWPPGWCARDVYTAHRWPSTRYHPVGTRRVERHAVPLGALHRVRPKGRGPTAPDPTRQINLASNVIAASRTFETGQFFSASLAI